MKTFNYIHRKEEWVVTIEYYLISGNYVIAVTGDEYPVVEKVITDSLENKNLLIEQLIDRILDNYFWNINN
jgi:predicted DNA repair protein MutK